MSYQNISQDTSGATTPVASARKLPWKWIGAATVAVIVIAYGFTGQDTRATNDSLVTATLSKSAYHGLSYDDDGEMKLFDDTNRFVMEDYDAKPNFASFLPGVAGLYGKPVWAFYVNQGQGIASFGVISKNFPILEFNAANKAYQNTPFLGFRTFIKGHRGKKEITMEPFHPASTRNLEEKDQDKLPKRIMFIDTNEVEVRDIDTENELSTSVRYIVLPNENFGALVRRTTITNDGDTPVTISVLDGLAKLEPVGGGLDWGLKNMGRTLEGWMGVYQADEDSVTMPYYRMSTEPSDSASVKIEEAGHYLLAMIEDANDDAKLLPIIYDTNAVFGQDSSLTHPLGFHTKSVEDLVDTTQYGQARTSSGFAGVEEKTLQPGESFSIASFYGKSDHIDEIPALAERVTKAGYVAGKFTEARTLIDELTSGVETNTTNKLFDGAVKQMFLDNALRGGIPQVLGNVDDDAFYSNYDEDERVKVFHTFSRIHGDLERDYNAFNIDYTYFSQGPGNFRDVAQNRRDDVTFAPRIGSFDVQEFLSYIQADGYEPLTVEAVVYMIKDEAVAANIAALTTCDPKSSEVLRNIIMGGAFRPGQMFDLMDRLDIKLCVEKEVFLDQIMAASEDLAMGVYDKGYWADHWEYYLDLINSYLQIYPDGEEKLMYDQSLRYFFSTASIKPRSEKYVVTWAFDGQSKHILQLDSTEFDQSKEDEQEAFRSTKTGVLSTDAYWQRTPNGGAFRSSPIAKFFLLGAIKFATRDAWGMGIEYEGGRPGWNDAMNGLPGMVGSGMPETYELHQILQYLKKVVSKYQRPIVVPAELKDMVDRVNAALKVLAESSSDGPEDLESEVPQELFDYWDTVATAREEYRETVSKYYSGETSSLTSTEVITMIEKWIEQVEIGMQRAIAFGSFGHDDDGESGIPPSYFSYDITKWELNGNKNKVGLPLGDAKAMKVGRFPLFLEGPVRWTKTVIDDKEALRTMYGKVKESGLRDQELNMYFLSASLEGQSYDMGRMMAFSPGWLENQSIWMHMSYKYYLQLIRGKLFTEFFSEMRGGGMLPYMEPTRYGRSLMECSSFLASSAFPDESFHGRGFSARLSGSTAEFLSIWKLIFLGPELFSLDENNSLQFQFKPAVPYWMFVEEGLESTYDEAGNPTVSFKLFSKIIVTYHNTKGTDLFDIAPTNYTVTMTNGVTKLIQGSIISSDLAKTIRVVHDVRSIDAFF
uniref:Uncharacterized protein n=1 Tax=Eucampia antarctica TaxID=49252 RepID=A0A7S2VZP1_9STRA|mmetsp:Transcript_138/g.135  ORF Transcript_138/g.135 Transcript_138/m.135 type:complete len:1215 (+) Transcript_138:182-3826(+)